VDDLIGMMVMLAVPTCAALQIRMALRYRGGWRTAALAPLVVMVPLLIYTAAAFIAQSNLWPLLPILVSSFALGYLAIVAVLHARLAAG